MNKKRAQALIELALVIPMLMVIVVGAVDFVLLTDDKRHVDDAVREAVRTSVNRENFDVASRSATAAYRNTLELRGADLRLVEPLTYELVEPSATWGNGTVRARGLYHAPVRIHVGWLPFLPDHYDISSTQLGSTVHFVEHR